MEHIDQRAELIHHATSVSVDLPDWIDSVVDGSRQYRTDKEKMDLAIELSRQNVLHGTGGPFGAAIFDRGSGQLLGIGVNRVVPSNNSTLHGEIVAIMMAEKSQNSFTLASGNSGRELVTSCEPCAMCLGAILWSGVNRVVCGATSEDARAIGFDEGPVFPESYEYLQTKGIEVVREVDRDKARSVLVNYAAGGGAIYNGSSDSVRE